MDIVLSDLRKSYRDGTRELTVIDRLSLVVPRGRSVAIVGPSGIGKSTLLHLMGGLDRPSGGSVAYGDTDLTRLGPEELASFRGRHVGFVFQFHHLLGEFTALENVAMPLYVRGVPRPEAESRAAEVLSRMGLSDRSGHVPGRLSGGEQQRVAIGRAVVARPAVILADEPTGSLDRSTADDVRRLLFEAHAASGASLVVVTHSEGLARACDVVLEMSAGGGLEERSRGEVTT